MAFNIETTKERLSELFKNESQEAVGKKLNMTQGNVSKLLTGKQQPTVETIFQIAKEYNVSTDWLLGLTEEKKIAKQDMSYGDILKMFSILGEKGALWPFCSTMHTVDGIDKELPMVTNVGIGDEILQSILYEWKTMLQSQEDIYQMWLDKRLKEYSEIDYISWDEDVKNFFYECRPLQGVSHEFLKVFFSVYKEKNCPGDKIK